MSFADIHSLFETKSPDGIGVALLVDNIVTAAKQIISSLSTPTLNINSDIGLPQFPNLAFSYIVDPASFQLTPAGELSLALTLTIHPVHAPAAPIVTVTLDVNTAKIGIGSDPISGNIRWIPLSNTPGAVGSPAWGPDANVIRAGYVKSDGTADWDRFKQDVYYGFIWVTSTNLLMGLIANLPLPQVQKWFSPFILASPINGVFANGYVAIWSNNISVNAILCGATNSGGSPNVTTHWTSNPVPSGPLSPIDAQSPAIALYMGAQQVITWKSQGLMPAVMFDTSGGGYVKWDVRASAGLESLVLTLTANASGGSLALHGNLLLLGDASAWIDGPSGTTIASVDESLKASAALDASLTIGFDIPSLSIELDTAINVVIDRSTVQLGGGLPWPIGSVINSIIDFLISRGAIELPALYQGHQHAQLYLLNKLANNRTNRAALHQRVGARSVLYGMDFVKG